MSKHILLTVIVLIFNLFYGYAQSKGESKSYQFAPGSEIRIAAGMAPIDVNTFFGSNCYDEDIYYGRNYASTSIGESLTHPSTYYGSTRLTGAYSASYIYRFKKWFELSGTITYSGAYRTAYYRINDQKAYCAYSHLISFLPTARFVWLRTKYVSMYSSVSLGLGIQVSKGTTSYNELVLAANFNPVGITVGRKVYWFFDVALGGVGLFSTGVGYRFNY